MPHRELHQQDFETQFCQCYGMMSKLGGRLETHVERFYNQTTPEHHGETNHSQEMECDLLQSIEPLEQMTTSQPKTKESQRGQTKA